jgi:hypothetical protein
LALVEACSTKAPNHETSKGITNVNFNTEKWLFGFTGRYENKAFRRNKFRAAMIYIGVLRLACCSSVPNGMKKKKTKLLFKTFFTEAHDPWSFKSCYSFHCHSEFNGKGTKKTSCSEVIGLCFGVCCWILCAKPKNVD